MAKSFSPGTSQLLIVTIMTRNKTMRFPCVTAARTRPPATAYQIAKYTNNAAMAPIDDITNNAAPAIKTTAAILMRVFI
jgi:hypothetical protein